MASPPTTASPTAMSPPNPSPAQLPNKKRSSTFDNNGQKIKRRKASIASQSSGLAHPLRQTSFPPEAAVGSPRARSQSVDATSQVSGSVVSGVTKGKGRGKGGGRGKKNKDKDSKEATPSVAGGKAPTTANGQDDDEDDDDDDKAEMAVEDVAVRTQEQKQEEIRMRAMLVESFDPEQYNRYELWRAAKLSDAVVKRVVNATVSQSVPQMVSTAVKAVAKLFAGELIEHARKVQADWIHTGEVQADLAPEMMRALERKEDSDKDKEDGDKDDEPDLKRGPLRPDHLREAWRRYKQSVDSKSVGVQQPWHIQQGSGVERFSTRTRKRIFK